MATKIIHCDCGYIVRGKNDEELIADAQKHAREVHGMELTSDQVLAMARPESSPMPEEAR